MIGYVQLKGENTATLLERGLGIGKPEPFRSDDLYQGNKIEFFDLKEENLIIVTTPIMANEYPTLLKKFPGKQILVGLQAAGMIEDHIFCAYASADADRQTIKLIDSKNNDAQKFFGPVGFFSGLRNLFRSFLPQPGSHIQISIEVGQVVNAEYLALGTQSIFDSKSCGYHVVANILACRKLLDDNSQIATAYLSDANVALTRENLLAKTNNPVLDNPVIDSANANVVKTSFFSFVKKAWFDTVLPTTSEDERSNEEEFNKEKLQFTRYFLGFPLQKGNVIRIALYIASFSWLVTPLLNTIRRPPEFLLNLAAETTNFLKNKLIAWAPTNSFTQYLRSTLLLVSYALQGLFKGLYFLLRSLTSPLSSFQAALKTENLILRIFLCTTSVLLSLASFAALAFFSAPAAFSALGLPATFISPALKILASGIVKLFSLMGLTIAPITGAVVSLALTISSLFLLNTGVKWLISKVAEPIFYSPHNIKFESYFHDVAAETGSNVVDAFNKAQNIAIAPGQRNSTCLLPESPPLSSSFTDLTNDSPGNTDQQPEEEPAANNSMSFS